MRAIILIIWLCTAYYSVAQSVLHYNLSDREGFPSGEIYQIIQDDFGFMWVGCDDGLYRYDGIRFVNFSNISENSKGKSGLQKDKKGRIWCHNFTGQIFYTEDNSLQLFKDFTGKFRSFPSFLIDKNDAVWVCGDNKLLKYSDKGKLLKELFQVQDNDTLIWSEIKSAPSGNIYAISAKGTLFRLVDKGPEITFEKIIQTEEGNRIYFLLAEDHKVFLRKENISNGQNTLLEVFLNGKTDMYYPENCEFFFYKLFRTPNEYQLCTSKGVYSLSKKKITLHKPFLPGEKISWGYTDKNNNAWFAALQNALYLVPNTQIKIWNNVNSGLQDNFTSCLNESKAGILIGTYSGEVFLLNEKQEINPVLQNQNRKIKYRQVKKIQDYKNGQLLSRGPMMYVKEQTEKFLKVDNVRDFCIYKDTFYYTSSYYTGYIPLTKGFDAEPVVLMKYAGRSVAIDSLNASIYFATNNGLIKYQYGKTTPILMNGEKLYADKLLFHQNKIWISSLNNGLVCYQNNQLEPLTRINKLINGSRIKTFRFFKNLLFAATEKGISIIDAEKNTARFIDPSDGFFSIEIRDLILQNNLLTMATNKGLLQVSLNALNKQYACLPVQITSVKAGNEEMRNTNRNFTFNYRQRNIRFSFISPFIPAKGASYYLYRLLPSDTTWFKVNSTDNKAIFSSLSPGDYVFEVKSFNESGESSCTVERVTFSINKPFWNTWWFYSLAIICLGFIAYLIFWYYVKSIRKKEHAKMELINSQLRAIRAQMNPHFMYNTLSSIQDLILKNDFKNTNYYLSKFSTLMRSVLEFSEKETISIQDEIDMLDNYLQLEKLRFGNEFTYTITCDKQISAYQSFIPSLIIQPFVENATKHGLLHKKGERKLLVNFQLINSGILITIEDNGVGRIKAGEIKDRNPLKHHSFSVSAVQKRLDLLNEGANIKITFTIQDLYRDNEAVGTLVKIFIPESFMKRNQPIMN